VPYDPFCSKELIAKQIYFESKHINVLYNIHPILPGHSLLVPKRHVENIGELSEEEWKDILKALDKVLPVLLKLYSKGSSSYNLSFNVGPYSGRVISHLHMHIVPRWKNDPFSKDANALYAGLYKDIYEKDATKENITAEIERLRKIFKYKPAGAKA